MVGRPDAHHVAEKVLELLDEGSAKARDSARQTMSRVRDSIFHWSSKRASL